MKSIIFFCDSKCCKKNSVDNSDMSLFTEWKYTFTSTIQAPLWCLPLASNLNLHNLKGWLPEANSWSYFHFLCYLELELLARMTLDYNTDGTHKPY